MSIAGARRKVRSVQNDECQSGLGLSLAAPARAGVCGDGGVCGNVCEYRMDLCRFRGLPSVPCCRRLGVALQVAIVPALRNHWNAVVVSGEPRGGLLLDQGLLGHSESPDATSRAYNALSISSCGAVNGQRRRAPEEPCLRHGDGV